MTRCLTLALPFLGAAFSLSTAVAQTQPSGCGDVITVQRGDTLSSIAQRCDVTERSLMRINPRIEGSRDLRVGMQLQTRGEDADGLGRLGSLAGQAAGVLSDFARDVGSSAQDLLDRNPDLRQRLERFEGQVQNSGTGSVNGTVSVTPKEIASGEALTVTARGLPSDTPVVVGAGQPQAAYEIIEKARTGPDGTLRVDVRIPDWAADMRRLTFVVSSEGGEWTVRSEPVTVTGTRL